MCIYIYIYIWRMPNSASGKSRWGDEGFKSTSSPYNLLSWTSALHQIFTDHMLWIWSYTWWWGFPGGTVGKNPPANTGDARDLGLIPVLGKYPGVGNGNPLQCSCLENPVDRGAWWATVHWVAETGTQLSDWAQHSTYTGWWGYSSEQKRLSLPDWWLFSNISAQRGRMQLGFSWFQALVWPITGHVP